MESKEILLEGTQNGKLDSSLEKKIGPRFGDLDIALIVLNCRTRLANVIEKFSIMHTAHSGRQGGLEGSRDLGRSQ